MRRAVIVAPPATVALPLETPIPCLICKAEMAQSTLTFAGTVQLAQAGRLRVFDAATRQTMGFAVPADFRGVASSDGSIKAAALDRVTPGLLVRVTYQTAGGSHVATAVLLLTLNQCRALQAAERISKSPAGCPD